MFAAGQFCSKRPRSLLLLCCKEFKGVICAKKKKKEKEKYI